MDLISYEDLQFDWAKDDLLLGDIDAVEKGSNSRARAPQKSLNVVHHINNSISMSVSARNKQYGIMRATSGGRFRVESIKQTHLYVKTAYMQRSLYYKI